MQLRFILSATLLLCFLIAKSQSSEVILQNHLNAIGGEKKWSSIQSLSYRTITEMHGVTTKAEKKWIKHKSYRSDFEIFGRVPSDTNPIYTIRVNLGKGVKKMPDQINQRYIPMDSLECAYYILQNELENPFVDSKQKGIKVQYHDTEYFNETYYHKFLIHYPSGYSEYCYLDPKTWLIYMRVSLNTETENVRTYLDYLKTKDGLVFPKRFETAEGTVTVENLELNPKFKSDIFLLPTK